MIVARHANWTVAIGLETIDCMLGLVGRRTALARRPQAPGLIG
jgi:hypothetical protein